VSDSASAAGKRGLLPEPLFVGSGGDAPIDLARWYIAEGGTTCAENRPCAYGSMIGHSRLAGQDSPSTHRYRSREANLSN